MPNSSGNIIDAGDVLIIGAGLAGLFTALKLQPRPVTIMAAGRPDQGTASSWAQGGIAAALGDQDCPENHAADTIAAGDGLVDPKVAHILAQEAPERIADLIDYSVPFNRKDDGSLALGREAAHGHDRIVGVAGDRAGHEIMRCLSQKARSNPAIRFVDGMAAYELAVEDDRVVGVFARPSGVQSAAPLLIKARAVILATGGSGHLFEVTTNPVFANGEAIAMAARAGADIADIEFVQFHPTAFFGMGDPAPLATEALRGEGAWLVNRHGQRFMTSLHADAELAPRDIVARAVFRERRRTGFVGLDLTRPELNHLTRDFAAHFPTVAATCKTAGLDPQTDFLPVAPAAHYHMGGVKTDLNGRASLSGLWVCGEAACTGAHGANRLASNSLLEALVFGARIARDVNSVIPHRNISSPRPSTLSPHSTEQTERPLISQLRKAMTQFVGVERDASGLKQAITTLLRLERTAHGWAPMANMTATALMISVAAYQRQESRGGHFRHDFSSPAAQATRSILTLDQTYSLAEQIAGAPAPDTRRFIQ
jgi:L-aspartate oxidase